MCCIQPDRLIRYSNDPSNVGVVVIPNRRNGTGRVQFDHGKRIGENRMILRNESDPPHTIVRRKRRKVRVGQRIRLRDS